MPSQYTMMRNGTITGISVHCVVAPNNCNFGNLTTNPKIDAFINQGATPAISVTIPGGSRTAFSVSPNPATSNYIGGDTISVFSNAYSCNPKPKWCTILVEHKYT